MSSVLEWFISQLYLQRCCSPGRAQTPWKEMCPQYQGTHFSPKDWHLVPPKCDGHEPAQLCQGEGCPALLAEQFLDPRLSEHPKCPKQGQGQQNPAELLGLALRKLGICILSELHGALQSEPGLQGHSPGRDNAGRLWGKICLGNWSPRAESSEIGIPSGNLSLPSAW